MYQAGCEPENPVFVTYELEIRSTWPKVRSPEKGRTQFPEPSAARRHAHALLRLLMETQTLR